MTRDLLAACKFGDGARNGPDMLRHVADILEERGPSDYAHLLRGKAMMEEAAIVQAEGEWAERAAGVQVGAVLLDVTARCDALTDALAQIGGREDVHEDDLALAVDRVWDLLNEEAQRCAPEDSKKWRSAADLLESISAALFRVLAWCEAYPVEAFPEPDMAQARALLQAGGIDLGAVAASNMRHVLKGIERIIQEALNAKENPA